MTIRTFGVLLVTLTGVAACDGIKEALTAHVGVVAKANDQELSVDRLAQLLGRSTLQIPVNRETATLIADLWTGYHLLGVSAAHGDSVIDPKLIDEATQAIAASMRLNRYMQAVNEGFAGEQPSEATYTQAAGGLFHARHILFAYPEGATQVQRDSVRRRAQSIRAQTTAANFATMASRHSGDPGSAERGGDLGTFPRDMMVKPFGDAVAALRPGEISGLVETQYGYHIIQRSTYAAARAEYDARYGQVASQAAESTYIAGVDAAAKIAVRSGAPASVKAAARDFPSHRRDRDVLATYTGGSLTLGRFVQWVELMPPSQRVAQQIQASPDSLVRIFVESVARNEVLLSKADSAGVTLTDDEQKQLHAEFGRAIVALWNQLGVDPQSLSDSARTVPERERVAAARIELLMDRIMMGEAQPIQLPTPAKTVLTLMYPAKVTAAGIDRAVELATKVRASADSARVANQPPSQVPMPGSPPAGQGTRP